MLDARAIHAKLGANGWREVLVATGIHEKFLRDKHGPCPACGGKDRYRFDNQGRGTFICSRCGAGDGFKLVMLVAGLSFSDARRQVMALAGIEESDRALSVAKTTSEEMQRAEPTLRVLAILRESCQIADCESARAYLESRCLWPLPNGSLLRAHAAVTYWHERQKIGVYPALVTPVRDGDGELVTAHVTYLTHDGRKLDTHEPRKMLSPLVGHESCVAPIMEQSGPVLGVAEGIETALSAAKLTGIPTWSTLNAGLLAKFTPPESVDRLVIFADRDVAGLEAATALMERLQERVRLEIRTPRAKDWNDILKAPR